MSLFDGLMSKIGYVRYADGSNFYQMMKGNTSFLGGSDKLKIARENPVLSACIQIRANLLSKVEFYQENESGEKITDSEEIKLLNNPNAHQSKQDFLKQYEWYKSTYGWVYQKPYAPVGMASQAIFNLRSSYIEFPNKMLSGIAWSSDDIQEYYEQSFKYKEPQQEVKKFELKEIIPFFDVSNGLSDDNKSSITSPSKIDSIIKSISNIGLALSAENVMIQSNGREIFSSEGKGSNLGVALPMDDTDRTNINKKLINGTGVGFGKIRSMVTNKPITHQSIHIKLDELGLHKSISANANIVTQAYEVPNEIYKAFTKGDTFENQREALIGMYQNVIQPVADDLCSSWNAYFEIDNPIKASFEHLPVMQHTEERKANKILKIAMAYEKLQRAGLSDESIADLFQGQGINILDDD